MMSKIYKYSVDDIHEYKLAYENIPVLSAVSTNDDGSIYFYDFDHKRFREVVGTTNEFFLPVINSEIDPTEASAYKRQKYDSYARTVLGSKWLEKIVSNNKESLAAETVYRIVGIRKGIRRIKVDYASDDDKEIVKTFVIEKNISEYEELFSILNEYKNKTKDLCENCHCFMSNGKCPICGGKRKLKDNLHKQVMGVYLQGLGLFVGSLSLYGIVTCLSLDIVGVVFFCSIFFLLVALFLLAGGKKMAGKVRL